MLNTVFAESVLPTLILSLTLGTSLYANDTHDINVNALFAPVPETAQFKNDAYYIWGASMVAGPEDKYHLFYSRCRSKAPMGACLEAKSFAATTCCGPTQTSQTSSYFQKPFSINESTITGSPPSKATPALSTMKQFSITGLQTITFTRRPPVSMVCMVIPV